MSDLNDQAAPDGIKNADQALMSPGAKLAAYRNERGWTVEQVASQLNLAPRQIAAIESDDYAALPGMPIVRGFIRAYAKLLKVDAAPLLPTLESETAPAGESIVPRKTLSTPFSEARLPTMMDRPGVSSKWIIGLLLALLLGVAIWAGQQGGDIAEMSKSASSQVKDGLAGMAGVNKAEQQQAPGVRSEEPAVPPTPVGGSAVVPEPGVPPVAPDSKTAPAPAAKSMAAPGAPAIPEGTAPAGANTLLLKAREDSWIELRRSRNNSVAVSRIVKAGESETVEVTEPMSLVIGNAAGVDASLRGTPIELKPGTKSNVARVTLK